MNYQVLDVNLFFCNLVVNVISRPPARGPACNMAYIPELVMLHHATKDLIQAPYLWRTMRLNQLTNLISVTEWEANPLIISVHSCAEGGSGSYLFAWVSQARTCQAVRFLPPTKVWFCMPRLRAR